VETASRALDSHLSSNNSLLIKLHHSLWEEMQLLFFLSISSKMLYMGMVLQVLHRVMPLEVSLNNNSSKTDKLANKEATLSMVEVLALSFTESIYISIYLTIKNNFTFYIFHQSKKRSSTSLFSSRFFFAFTLL
jgi:hypothetical protein